MRLPAKRHVRRLLQAQAGVPLRGPLLLDADRAGASLAQRERTVFLPLLGRRLLETIAVGRADEPRRGRCVDERRIDDVLRECAPRGVLLAHARLRPVPRHEPHLQRGRLRLQMPVAVRGIDEERILEPRIEVVPFRAPRLEPAPAEGVRRDAVHAPVEVAVEHDVLHGSPGIAAEEVRLGVRPPEHVVRDDDRRVLLHARAPHAVAVEGGEDVVAEHVLLAVVLVHGAVAAALHEVRGEHDAVRPLVRVESPRGRARAGIAVHVVHPVAHHLAARAVAERVEAAHVREHAPADVVDAVERDAVAAHHRGTVPPRPAHRDARVAEVADVVVLHRAVVHVPEPHADRAVEEAPAVPDDAVDHLQAARCALRRRHARVAEVHAAAAEVLHERILDRAVVAVVAQPDSVRAHVRHASAREHEPLRARRVDRRVGHVDRALCLAHARRGKIVRRVLERDAAERDVLHARLGRAREHHEGRRHGRHGARRRNSLARARNVEELPRLLVQEPLARRVQRAAVVLEHVARTRARPEEAGTRKAPSEHHETRLGVDVRERHVARAPALPGDHVHARQFLLREPLERRQVCGLRVERAVRHVLELAREGVLVLLVRRLHVEVELVRRARARRAPPVHPQLVEQEPIRHARLPDAVRAYRERWQLHAAVKHGLAARRASEVDAAVGGAERDGLRHAVASRQDLHLGGAPRGNRPRRAQRAHFFNGRRERRHVAAGADRHVGAPRGADGKQSNRSYAVFHAAILPNAAPFRNAHHFFRASASSTSRMRRA